MEDGTNIVLNKEIFSFRTSAVHEGMDLNIGFEGVE
jgi:hypothetical protein